MAKRPEKRSTESEAKTGAKAKVKSDAKGSKSRVGAASRPERAKMLFSTPRPPCRPRIAILPTTSSNRCRKRWIGLSEKGEFGGEFTISFSDIC